MRAGSSGLRRSSIDELLDVSREEGELWIPSYANREPGETDPLAISDGGEKRSKIRKIPRGKSP